jgi:hypothetical protein
MKGIKALEALEASNRHEKDYLPKRMVEEKKAKRKIVILRPATPPVLTKGLMKPSLFGMKGGEEKLKTGYVAPKDSFFHCLYKLLPFHTSVWSPWPGKEWVTPKMSCRLELDEAFSISPLKEMCKFVEDNFKCKLLFLYGNLYETGENYIGYHHDHVEDPDLTITASFGTSRDFFMKNDETKEREEWFLEDGDVYSFDRAWNKAWKHSLPKRTRIKTPRVALIFFCSAKTA